MCDLDLPSHDWHALIAQLPAAVHTDALDDGLERLHEPPGGDPPHLED